MPRLLHGASVNAHQVADAQRGLTSHNANVTLGFLAATPGDLHNFDYLFPDLQSSPDNLLPESPQTLVALKTLSATMEDDDQPGGDNDSPIPAAYTYFGQFIDHDVTLEVQSGDMTQLLADDMVPLPLADAQNAISNGRTATLDLDSLYGMPAPREPGNPAKMRIGIPTRGNGTAAPSLRPPNKDDANDLPREPRSADPTTDRAALIGDPRNDENLVVAQLHVAFLRAHNRLVDEGYSFEDAQRILRQHYQHIVIHDFLKRIADPAVVDKILHDGNQWFNSAAEPFFMPLEFSVAAYRFGHSMVRAEYNFNLNFNLNGGIPASLEFLFTFSALSGQLGFGAGTDTLPDNWIVEWENLIGDGPQMSRARRLDPALAAIGGRALFNLQTVDGKSETGLAARLAARNLLRGYRLRIPTGQAIAGALGLTPLSSAELENAAINQAQKDALRDGGFLERTPLWFYILAEARAAGGGRHLGPLGSTLVAEVLIGLIRRSESSILRTPGWQTGLPALGSTFELADILRLTGQLPGGVPLRTAVVQPGDSLSKIAQVQLGDAARWPEIFAANRAVLRNPDLILPGQRLMLPTGPAHVPQLRFHVVRSGETLSGIAKELLGDGNRWPDIFTLNGDVLTNPNLIVVGQVLAIPPN